jgi:tetratricopeptide (TPR) repeat protein
MRPVRRRFEVEADLEAARVTSNAGVIAALRESAAASHCYLMRNGGAAPAPSLWEPNEFTGFRAFWFSAAGQMAKLEVLKELQSRPTQPGDDYPSLGERLRALENARSGKTPISTPDADGPAYLLFADSLASLQEEFVRLSEQPNAASSPDEVAQPARFAHGMGSLPGNQKPASREHGLEIASFSSVWRRYFGAWRTWGWRLKTIDICLLLGIIGAVVMVEHRVVLNVKAQYLVLGNERNFPNGQETEDRQQLSQAISAFREAARMNPRYARAFNDLGFALQNQWLLDKDKNNYDQAIKNYEQATTLNPHYPLAYLNWGRSLYFNGEYSNAVRSFGNAAQLDRGTGSSQHSLGTVYRTMYRLGKDKKDLDMAKTYFCAAASGSNRPAKWAGDCANPAGDN